MENQFFLNAGIPPPGQPLHFGPSFSSPMSSWQPLSLSPAMEIQATELNCSLDQSQDCFLNPNWEKSTDYGLQFDSALSSMVSSPAASNSNISNESFMIRELIGKLGSIGNSGEISPHSQPLLASYINGNNSANTSCYSTPLNSPPKLNLPMMDSLVKEKLPSLGKPMGLNSSVAEFSADPGFAERAAKFSCFGSRSFNGRSQFGLSNNNEISAYRSNPLTTNAKLPRVSSSPTLEAMGSQVGAVQGTNNNYPLQDRSELANSQEESTVSELNPNGDPVFKASKDSNSRKRKAVPKAKTKETSSSPSANAAKVSEPNEESNEKRCKSTESNGNENDFVKAEEDAKGGNGNAGDEKQNKTNTNNNTKPPEPPKDYIHVRARRGQATDSHSLSERVRREKISERMKLLQNIVPGCNKVTGKALMLDEIINYVQSLRRQVEFLSMKLTSVNTRLDFNVDNLMSKEDRSELANSQEESTVSEQNPNGDLGFKASKDSNSRKREAVPKAKTKETSASPSANAAKVSEANGESNEKRCKSTESNGNENGFVKAEEDTKLGSNGNAGDEKQNKTKPPEPHKDYIHVRARRGQATDSHSLAERVRREKISERMKLLQDLVPGCNKVTGKALMLDEIINYVQSLQRQVEFLSMKLVSVNTRLDFNLDNIFQSNNTVPHPIFPIDSTASALFGHQPRQNPALHSNISNGTMTQCSVDPLDAVICPNLNTHLPPINQFTETAPQGQIKYPT